MSATIHRFERRVDADYLRRLEAKRILAEVDKQIRPRIKAHYRQDWLAEAGAIARASLVFLAVIFAVGAGFYAAFGTKAMAAWLLAAGTAAALGAWALCSAELGQ